MLSYYDVYDVKTVRDLVYEAGLANGNDPVLRDLYNGQFRDVSFAEFTKICEAVSGWVAAESRKAGHKVRVAMMAPNSTLYYKMLVGVMYGGCVAVPMDPQMEETAICRCLNKAEVDILILDASLQKNTQAIKAGCPGLRSVLNMDDCETLLTQYAGSSDRLEVSSQECAVILFTSGTTGEEKGVMLSNGNLVDSAFNIEHPHSHYVKVNILPLHHAFCLNVDVILSFTTASVTCFNGDVTKLGENLQLFRPSFMAMVPRVAQALHSKIYQLSLETGYPEAALRDKVFGDRLKTIITGGAHLPAELVEKYSALGISIQQGYGMTECSPAITTPDMSRLYKPESVGHLVRGCVARTTEDGELQVRGPAVMMGYVNAPELTAQILTEDGWLRTGDLGHIDEEGFVFITGRMKNLIILANGENVSPEQIENRLLDHQLIEECLVYGDGNTIVAEVFPSEAYAASNGIVDVPAAIERIVSAANENQPSYRVIGKCLIRTVPFQRTGSGKIIRAQRAAAHELLNLEEEELRLPETETQQVIYDCLSSILGHQDFGIDTEFLTAGLDSMGGMQLMTMLEAKLDFTLELSDLLEHNTVELLEALYLQSSEAEPEAQVFDKIYPLTEAQKLYAYHRRGFPLSTIPMLVKLPPLVSKKTITNALTQLCDLHPILKNVVHEYGDGFANFRDDERPVQIDTYKLSKVEWEEKKKDMIPLFLFDKDEPLYRFEIYQVGTELYLFCAFSHIICDGTSMKMLMKDLLMMIFGRPVEPETYTMYDYIQNHYALPKQVNYSYYAKLLDGCKIKKAILSKKGMPSDATKQYVTFKDAFCDIDRDKVLGFCDRNNVSEAALFNTAFAYCVSLFADESDALVFSTHSGRADGRLQQTIGDFAATYTFRRTFCLDQPVLELLRGSVSQMVETMSLGDSAICPIVPDDMLFQYQGDMYEIPAMAATLVKVTSLAQHQLPFHLIVMCGKKGYTYEMRYRTDRHEEPQVRLFVEAMSAAVVALTEVELVGQIYDRLPASLFPTNGGVLDRHGRKQVIGGWGWEMCDGVLTGAVSRVLPDGTVEAFEESGRVVKSPKVYNQYVDLAKVEAAIKSYPGVTAAEVYLTNDGKNTFHLVASVQTECFVDRSGLEHHLQNTLASHEVPGNIIL